MLLRSYQATLPAWIHLDNESGDRIVTPGSEVGIAYHHRNRILPIPGPDATLVTSHHDGWVA